MMGIPKSGSSYIYVDNMSVVHDTSSPESLLRNKSNSVAIVESIVGHIPHTENLVDLMEKVHYEQKRK